MVPGRGVEPLRLAALDPKSSVSANSTTQAYVINGEVVKATIHLSECKHFSVFHFLAVFSEVHGLDFLLTTLGKWV